MTEELEDQFRSTLSTFCKACRDNQVTVREYSLNSIPTKDSLQFLSMDEYPQIHERVAKSLAPGALTVFRNEPGVRKNLRFYALVAQLENGESLVGLRWLTPSQKPDRGKWPVAAVRNQLLGRYERLVEDLLLFDDQLDCLLYKDTIFIANRDKFERIFNFDRIISEVASEALSRVGEEVPIQNFEEFQAACMRSIDKQRKLAAVAQSVDLSKLNVESAERVVSENPRLSSILSTDEQGNQVLTYNTSRPWDLIRYLSLSTNRSVATGATIESYNHDFL